MKKYEKNGFDPLHFSTYRKSELFEGKPLSTRPPSVRGPKDCRLKRSGENMFPLVEITFPLVETNFPLGEYMFPLAEIKFPLVEFIFPLAEIKFPLGKFGFPLAEIKFPLAEIAFPLMKTNFPLGEFRFPLAENKFPSSELTKLFAEIKFCDHSKIRIRTKNTYQKHAMGQMKNHNFCTIKKTFTRQILKPGPGSHDKESHLKPPPPIEF